MSTLRQRLLAGGAWVVAGKVVTAGTTLCLGALLTRILSPAEVGVYFLAERLVWLVAFFSLLGLNTTVMRLAAEARGAGRPGRAHGVVLGVRRWAVAGVAAVSVVLAGGGGAWLARTVWDSEALADLMPWLALWAGLHALLILTSETFRGLQDLRLATLFGGVVSGVLALGTLGVLALLGRQVGLVELTLIVAGSIAASELAGLAQLRRTVARLGPPEPVAPREVFGISIPLWINGLLAYGFTQSDVLILAMFREADEVALYGAASRLVSLVLMSLVLVNLIVPPFIAELHARGEMRRLERMLRGTATLAGLPAIAVLAAYLALGPLLLGTVYGTTYRDGWPVLAILSVGRLVHVLSGSAAITLSMTGHERRLVRITAISTLYTVLASLSVVDALGSIGVAAATCSGVILQAVWVWLEAHRSAGLWTHVSPVRFREFREWLKLGA